VDGKSPVEYLDPVRAQFVREFTRQRVPDGGGELAALTAHWFEQSKKLPPIAAKP
jgi:hypothetical protein